MKNEILFDKTYFKNAVDKFTSLSVDGLSRYKSWEYCYTYFNNLHKKVMSNTNITVQEIDTASLNLAFYMASWGMYRGSSFLLQYDYKIFTNVVEIILQSGSDLWDLDSNIYNASDTVLREYAIKIFVLGSQIKECLQEAKNAFNQRSWFTQNQVQKPITDTIITKILLGCVGCIPAMDSFFCSAVGSMGNEFTEEKIYNILYLARKNYLEIIKIAKINIKDTSLHYPIMKLIDMYYFVVGNEKIYTKTIDKLINHYKYVYELFISNKIDNEQKEIVKVLKELFICQKTVALLDNQNVEQRADSKVNEYIQCSSISIANPLIDKAKLQKSFNTLWNSDYRIKNKFLEILKITNQSNE